MPEAIAKGDDRENGSGFRAAGSAFVALCLFVATFVAFMLAPVAMIAVIAGGMWWLERWGKRSKRGLGVRPPAPALPRSAGSTAETDAAVGSYGFGARVGENL